MSHRVVLVDEHEEIRRSLSDRIVRLPGFDVIGSVGSAAEALALLADLNRSTVDLIIVDSILGDGPDGIHLTKGIKARAPLMPVLFLSECGDSYLAERALLAGASGYLMKENAVETLYEAMETVIRQGMWLPQELLTQLLPQTLSPRDPSLIQSDLGRAILAEIKRGNRTAAGLALTLSQLPSAIEQELAALQRQLGLPSRVALLLYLR